MSEAASDDIGVVRKFFRNTAASTATFLLDLAILWTLVEFLAVPQVPAAAIAFVVPLVVFYFLQRAWVFPDNDRSVGKGLAVFAATVGVSFIAMMATYWALMEFVGLHYLIARVGASLVYGLMLFVLNGKFNFKEL